MRKNNINGREYISFILFPRKQTALYNALLVAETGDSASREWGLGEQLLAGIYDSIVLFMWSFTGDKSKPPQPIPRPGVEVSNNVKRYKGKKLSVEQAKKRLANITEQ